MRDNKELTQMLFQKDNHPRVVLPREAIKPKMLVVERELIANKGHYHTQISALQDLVRPSGVYLLTGPTYDGYLNFPYRSTDATVVSGARLAKQIAHGSLMQKLKGIAGAVVSSGLSNLPTSTFGSVLVDTIREFRLGSQDIVIIPSSDLDALASAIDALERLGAEAPSFHLRFFKARLGERDQKLRRRRVASLMAELPPRIALYCETEELAVHLAKAYAMPAIGGFYLPCSIDPSVDAPGSSSEESRLRIGVFGAPRSAKSSDRIGRIIHATAMAESDKSGGIDFVVQGSPSDFAPGGVYGGVAPGIRSGGNVTMVPFKDRVHPAAFAEMFRSVDAVLLPYDISVYGLQGSGVVQDAVAAGKCIVHSFGFSMASFLSHGNAIAARSDTEFAEAVLHLAANRARFARGCQAARAHFQTILCDHPLLRNLACGRVEWVFVAGSGN